MVCSATPGTQRYRHLIAADARFARIDPLTGGVGHGDGTERGLQLLSEPKRNLLRCCRNGVTDTRFSTVENRLRHRFPGHKQKRQQKKSDASHAAKVQL